jgi:uncharacterized RDD family membrane protein YckC
LYSVVGPTPSSARDPLVALGAGVGAFFRNLLVLRTPEGITFSLLLASPVSRFLAWTIDEACIFAVTGFVRQIFSLAAPLNPGLVQASLVIGYFLISIGYGMVCEWYWRGQTVGKRVLRLRVMDEEGLHLQPNQVIVRNLLRLIDILPGFYLVGGVFCLLTRRSQRLGDIAAGTVVVRQPRLVQPDIGQLLGGKYNSLLDYRHLGARLKQRVPPRTATVALDAILRRDQLDPAARLDVFADLAAHFKSLVEFPEEAIEQLSDEQYVRNVVEILYGGSR